MSQHGTSQSLTETLNTYSSTATNSKTANNTEVTLSHTHSHSHSTTSNITPQHIPSIIYCGSMRTSSFPVSHNIHLCISMLDFILYTCRQKMLMKNSVHFKKTTHKTRKREVCFVLALSLTCPTIGSHDRQTFFVIKYI